MNNFYGGPQGIQGKQGDQGEQGFAFTIVGFYNDNSFIEETEKPLFHENQWILKYDNDIPLLYTYKENEDSWISREFSLPFGGIFWASDNSLDLTFVDNDAIFFNRLNKNENTLKNGEINFNFIQNKIITNKDENIYTIEVPKNYITSQEQKINQAGDFRFNLFDCNPNTEKWEKYENDDFNFGVYAFIKN